jgi:hypothetical protein
MSPKPGRVRFDLALQRGASFAFAHSLEYEVIGFGNVTVMPAFSHGRM